ncbi:MAG: GMC oxidoreductase, partial [Pseudomonadota bacterium]
LRVSDAHHPATDLSRACLLAAQARGIGYSADLNSGDERGISLMQSTTFRGERWSAGRAFLHPLRSNLRLTLRCGASVSRVLIAAGRAQGVEYTDRGSRAVKRAFASAGVILTAGALTSPKLLMLSGIGAADHLKAFGLPVHVDLPGVGRNLSDHTKVPLQIRTTKNYGYSGEDSGLRVLRHGLQYALSRTGAASSTGSEVTGFFDPDEPLGEPTLQLYCLGTLFGEHGTRQPPGATLSVDLVNPSSVGVVRLRSADPAVPPAVDPALLTSQDDVGKLLSGLKFLREIIRTKPLADMVSEMAAPIAAARSDIDLIGYMRSTAQSNWHFAGTCRMGPDDDAMAVLDGNLKVRGIDGLWVFDASMMPKVVRANTNACAMAVAARACALLAG